MNIYENTFYFAAIQVVCKLGYKKINAIWPMAAGVYGGKNGRFDFKKARVLINSNTEWTPKNTTAVRVFAPN